MKNKKLVIIGTGEIANNAYEYFTCDSEYEVAAFSVNKNYFNYNKFLDLPVVCLEEIEKHYSPDKYYAFVALGNGKLNHQRTILYNYIKLKGYKFASYISSHAFVWDNVQIGDNCFILQNNVLEPFVKIGDNVTLWSGNNIGHRSIIHDNCFISSQIVISGMCEIGEFSFMGVNSCTAENVKIAENNFIAMGACVNKNTKPNSMYTGNPAKNMNINTLEYFGVNLNNEME